MLAVLSITAEWLGQKDCRCCRNHCGVASSYRFLPRAIACQLSDVESTDAVACNQSDAETRVAVACCQTDAEMTSNVAWPRQMVKGHEQYVCL